MIDTKVFGMNWIEVPAGKYKVTPPEKKRSSCQLEITFRYDTYYARLASLSSNIDLVMMPSYLIHQKAIGQKLRRYEFSVSISSVLVGRASFPTHLWIPLFKLQTW
jgi:hypothetical protein